MSLLSEDVDYKVPVRITKERFSDSTFSERSYFINDDHSSLSARVDRLNTDFAWSEDPPSRTRRLVTNIRIKGREGDEVSVENSILIQRNQGDTEEIDLLTAEREDTIRIVGDELELASRTVYLDHTVLDTDSLSIFL
jgi:3-phenylpropionate/cinnamic acid dioxygenase small subunit